MWLIATLHVQSTILTSWSARQSTASRHPAASATGCSIYDQMSHYQHWQLLTQPWNSSLMVVQVQDLCTSGTFATIHPQAVQPCSAELIQHLSASGMQAKRQLHKLGGGELVKGMDHIVNCMADVLAAPSKGKPVPYHVQCADANFTWPITSSFLEYSTLPLAQAQSGLRWVPRRSINLLTTFCCQSSASTLCRAEDVCAGQFQQPVC